MSTNSSTRRTLSEWVEYVQTLHYREIELSLERVRTVYKRLYPDGFKPKVISIAGTNGKGSCAELISSIYLSAGYKVGKFTSPHLVDFAERFMINGQPVSEAQLLSAFEKIERVRKEVGITFFEFGALLAIDLFSVAEVDVAVMEVGLGGRLDAINILDADVAIITSISKDHTAWLGDTLDQIGFEKVGIARGDAPCVVGIKEPQQSILSHCKDVGAIVCHLGRDFDYAHAESNLEFWQWRSDKDLIEQLPLPFAQAGVQLSNASVCLQTVKVLGQSLPVPEQALRDGLKNAQLLARCQVLSEQPLIILDVSHNQSSVKRLRDFIDSRQFGGRLIAVCGMLKDKEVQQSLAMLVDAVDYWYLASIDHERGASAQYISRQLGDASMALKNSAKQDRSANDNVACFEKIVDAFVAAQAQLSTNDCLVVFGSFFVAGDILEFVNGRPLNGSANVVNTI